jgi:hypothetical protein
MKSMKSSFHTANFALTVAGRRFGRPKQPQRMRPGGKDGDDDEKKADGCRMCCLCC